MCPTLIISGTCDVHLSSCKKAAEMAQDSKFPVKLIILEDVAHKYNPDLLEPLVWEFLHGCELKQARPFAPYRIALL